MDKGLTNKLLATDTHWQMENPSSPLESHWVYQPHSMAGSMLSSTKPAQNKLNGIFVDILSSFYFGLTSFFCLFNLLIILILLVL